MYHKKRKIHFVGIGGIGMSGIAEVLLNLGHHVSGSDLQANDYTVHLAELGAIIRIGHREENAEKADVVVVSSAIPQNNPEVVAARRLFIPVIPRAEMLAELMRLKFSIAVAGSHGKTTTTSLMGSILNHVGFEPTLVIGGKLNNIGVNALLGKGDFLVAEADESDGSILLLSPTIAVVTNIDLEHLNYYRDIEHLKETFLTFINKVPFYGLAVLCLDDKNVQSLLPDIKKRYLTYGLSAQAEVTAKNIKCKAWGHSFNLIYKGRELGKIEVNIPGAHNILNTLAAIAVALEIDVNPKDLAGGVASMDGIGRRLEKKGKVNGITVIDDYGHHPTEIKATLQAIGACYADKRKVVVFQPHRYSRTKALYKDFLASFNEADTLYITEIYGAGEKAVEGLSGSTLAEAIRRHGHRDVKFEESHSVLVEKLKEDLQEGDILVTMGAGNVVKIADNFIESYKKL